MKPVYALVGEDSFLQLEKLEEIVRLGGSGLQRADFDGESAALADVLDELRSFAMFGDGKIVVVRNADALITRFREQLEEYLQKPTSGNATLVLRLSSLPANQRVYKIIQKVGVIERCEPPDKKSNLPAWIVKRSLSAHKLKIDPSAASLLADLIGNDLGRLDTELSKLALRVESSSVTRADVAGTIAFQREQEMSDLTNAIGEGNVVEALRRWRQLVQMDPSSEFRAVTWLAIWLENVRTALAMKRRKASNFEIGKAARIWNPQQLEGFLATCDKLGDSGVRRAIDLLTEVDRQIKSGIGEAATSIERFLVNVGITARK